MSFQFFMMPGDSPGNPSAVASPSPKACMYSQCFWRLIVWWMWIVPMFDDLIEDLGDGEPLVGVRLGVGQQVVAPQLAPRDVEARLGRDSALVECRRDGDDLRHRAGLVGVDGGEVAGRDLDDARVVVAAHRRHRVDLTGIGVHDDAGPAARPSPSTRPSSACSVANWIDRSSVRIRSSPGIGGTDTVSLPAIERPPGATSRSSRPPVPVRRSSNCNSRPPMPTPSMSVLPITLRPVSPPGRIRLLSGSTLTPASPRAAICSPTASSTWRATYMNPVALATIAATSSWRRSSLRPRTLVRIVAVPSGSSISLGLMLTLFAAHRHRQLFTVAIEDRAAIGGHVPGAGPLSGALDAQRVALARLEDADLEQHQRQHEHERAEQHDQPLARLPGPEPELPRVRVLRRDDAARRAAPARSEQRAGAGPGGAPRAARARSGLCRRRRGGGRAAGPARWWVRDARRIVGAARRTGRGGGGRRLMALRRTRP